MTGNVFISDKGWSKLTQLHVSLVTVTVTVTGYFFILATHPEGKWTTNPNPRCNENSARALNAENNPPTHRLERIERSWSRVTFILQVCHNWRQTQTQTQTSPTQTQTRWCFITCYHFQITPFAMSSHTVTVTVTVTVTELLDMLSSSMTWWYDASSLHWTIKPFNNNLQYLPLILAV